MMMDPSLLNLVVCPSCRAQVRANDEHTELACEQCGRAYPVRDGVPVLLVGEARKE